MPERQQNGLLSSPVVFLMTAVAQFLAYGSLALLWWIGWRAYNHIAAAAIPVVPRHPRPGRETAFAAASQQAPA